MPENNMPCITKVIAASAPERITNAARSGAPLVEVGPKLEALQ
jgi:hypothetical protein